jgi:hypothetical protein
MGGAAFASAAWLGFAGQCSRRRRNSKRGFVGNVDRSRRRPSRENREAEETADGTAGAPNRYGRYLDGRNTLNEQPIR